MAGTYSAHVRPGTISLLRPDGGFVWFDAEGRPLMRGDESVAFRRSLDGKVVRADGGGWADAAAEASALVEAARADAAAALAAAERAWEVRGPEAGGESPAARARRYLARAAAWTADALAADAERYAAVQGTVAVVPPAWYRAVYVRLAPGCPYDGCAFCDLYGGVAYGRRAADDLDRYLGALADALGEAAEGRVGIFLGDANPLRGPVEDVAAQVRRAAAAFPAAAAGGVGAFEDAFGPAPAPGRYARLAAVGLVEVNVGLESGSEEVLEILGKPSRPAAVAALVRAARAAGVGAALCVLVGAGGDRLAARHADETVRAVAACGLGPTDAVYLSPLRADRRGRLAARFAAAGLRPRDAAGLAEEEAEIARRLRAATAARIVPYRVDRFLS